MVPKATLPLPVAQQPCQEPLPNIDPRLGFFTPQPQPTLSPIQPQHEAPIQPLSPRGPRYSSPPSTIPSPSQQPIAYPPLPDVVSTPELDDSGSDDDDADGAQIHEPDIDERSDDEDDRAAHELLRAAPATAHDFANPLTLLPYNHQGFAVSWHVSFPPLAPAILTCIFNLGTRR